MVRLRLTRVNPVEAAGPFEDFDEIFRRSAFEEADQFYDKHYTAGGQDRSGPRRIVMRQALAGMLWSKQYFYYDVSIRGSRNITWSPGPIRSCATRVRNGEWFHMYQRRYHFDAGQVGISLVCGVGPGISHTGACSRSIRISPSRSST